LVQSSSAQSWVQACSLIAPSPTTSTGHTSHLHQGQAAVFGLLISHHVQSQFSHRGPHIMVHCSNTCITAHLFNPFGTPLTHFSQQVGSGSMCSTRASSASTFQRPRHGHGTSPSGKFKLVSFQPICTQRQFGHSFFHSFTIGQARHFSPIGLHQTSQFPNQGNSLFILQFPTQFRQQGGFQGLAHRVFFHIHSGHAIYFTFPSKHTGVFLGPRARPFFSNTTGGGHKGHLGPSFWALGPGVLPQKAHPRVLQGHTFNSFFRQIGPFLFTQQGQAIGGHTFKVGAHLTHKAEAFILGQHPGFWGHSKVLWPKLGLRGQANGNFRGLNFFRGQQFFFKRGRPVSLASQRQGPFHWQDNFFPSNSGWQGVPTHRAMGFFPQFLRLFHLGIPANSRQARGPFPFQHRFLFWAPTRVPVGGWAIFGAQQPLGAPQFLFQGPQTHGFHPPQFGFQHARAFFFFPPGGGHRGWVFSPRCSLNLFWALGHFPGHVCLRPGLPTSLTSSFGPPQTPLLGGISKGRGFPPRFGPFLCFP